MSEFGEAAAPVSVQKTESPGIVGTIQPRSSAKSIDPQVQSEISIAETNTNVESEKKRVAQREYVLDEEGNIIDIRYTQNGKSKTLQDVLPGKYNFKLLSVEEVEEETRNGHLGFGYDPYLGTVKFHEANVQQGRLGLKITEKERNAVIFHETGHAVDIPQNKKEYQAISRDRWLAKLKKELIKSCLASLPPERFNMLTITEEQAPFELRQSSSDKLFRILKNVSKEDLEELLFKTNGEKLRADCGEDIFDYLQREIATFYVQLEQRRTDLVEQKTDITLLASDFNQARDQQIESERRQSVLMERRAWTNALVAIRKLRDEGIDVYGGESTELLDLLDDCVATYELEAEGSLIMYSQNPENLPQFVKSRAAKERVLARRKQQPPIAPQLLAA